MSENDLIDWFTDLKGIDKIYLYESMAMLQAFKRLRREVHQTNVKSAMSHNISQPIIKPITDYEVDKFEDYINGK